jgi:hypothetical protein
MAMVEWTLASRLGRAWARPASDRRACWRFEGLIPTPTVYCLYDDGHGNLTAEADSSAR